MNDFTALFRQALAKAQAVLDDSREENKEAYIGAIRELSAYIMNMRTEEIEAASLEDLEALDTDGQFHKTLAYENMMLNGAMKGEKGELMVSTFVTYYLSRQKSYPPHSKMYMKEDIILKGILAGPGVKVTHG